MDPSSNTQFWLVIFALAAQASAVAIPPLAVAAIYVIARTV